LNTLTKRAPGRSEPGPVGQAGNRVCLRARRRDLGGRHLLANGGLPERVIHNDTKLSNVLIDNRSCEGICVVDLDTVMPGSALYDFGDMVRAAAMPAAEDERDLSQVFLDLDAFNALARGYLEEARDF